MSIKEMMKAKETLCHIQTGTRNALKCSKAPAESPPHREMKFFICDWCWDNGLDFMTEVVFNNGQRADVVILEWGVAIEVLKSEQHLNKRKKYPIPIIPFKILFCKTYTHRPELIAMLDDLKSTRGALVNYYVKKYGGFNEMQKDKI